jgi:GNAT superfamily N-acetyltransferase
MAPDDLAGAVTASAAAFGLELDSAASAERWRRRVEHGSDPDGSFVAEHGGRIVGVGTAIRRERLWVLSLLTVEPGGQSAGAGRALLDATLGYRRPGDAGLIVSSNDARAVRLYGSVGFRLHPTFEAVGALDRRRLPAGLPDVTDGAEDLEALAAITREVRGAPLTGELPYVLWRGSEILRLGDRGFTVAHPGQGVWCLMARDEDAARALLWHGLERAGEPESGRSMVRWITGAQEWAIDVLLRAGFGLQAYGALCVDGEPGTLRPYIPSGPFA